MVSVSEPGIAAITTPPRNKRASAAVTVSTLALTARLGSRPVLRFVLLCYSLRRDSAPCASGRALFAPGIPFGPPNKHPDSPLRLGASRCFLGVP